MKLAFPLFSLCLAFFCCQNQPVFGSDVGGSFGTVVVTVGDGSSSATTPDYKVVSAGLAGEAIYTGVISDVNATAITFEANSSTDVDGNEEDPFVQGVFNTGVKVPVLTASLSGGAVNAIAKTYAGSGFSAGNSPKVFIDYPAVDDNQSTATVTLDGSGAVDAVSITNGGAGYVAPPPRVSVVAGPHFVRLTQKGSSDVGRMFLITSNTSTQLTLDTSRLASGETLQNIFQVDYTVEIVPGNTLGGVMGFTQATCKLAPGSRTSADYVYLWDSGIGFYRPLFFYTGNSKYPAGWYNRNKMRAGNQNDYVIYPDEGIIVARRTSGAAPIRIDGTVSEVNQKMRLPASGEQVVMNNPFGTDVLLGEILPCGFFGNGATQFRTGSSHTDTNMDSIFFLSGSEWQQYYYKTGVNDSVTAIATATAKAGTNGSNNGMHNDDVSLASGTVTGLASCDASGNSVDHNVSTHTKVSLSAAAPLAGFTITFDEVSGEMINDNGDDELDINGTDVGVSGLDPVTNYSSLNGSHVIVASNGTDVVVKGRRDVNFNSAKGSKTWSTGSGGAGYDPSTTNTVKVYFVGGGGSGGKGDATVNGSGVVTGISVTTAGTGYTSAPQVVITGGGWRNQTGGNAAQDGALLGGDEGMIVLRRNPSGTLTYIEAINPNKK